MICAPRSMQLPLTLLIAAVALLAGATFAQEFPAPPAGNPLRSAEPASQATPPPVAESGVATQEPPASSEKPLAAQPQNGEDEGEQATPQPPTRERLTRAELEALLERVDALSLSDTEKADAKKYYQEALQARTELEQQQKALEERKAWYAPVPAPDDEGGPQRYTPAWYEKRLAMPVEEVLRLQPIDLQNDPTDYLQERAQARESYAAKWSKIVKDLEAAPNVRKQWLADLPSRRQAIEAQLAETTAAIEKIDQEGIASEVTAARRAMLAQREAKLQTELAAMEARRRAIGREEALHDLELKLAKRKAAKYAESLAEIRRELSSRRKQAADEQARAAQREADKHPQLIQRNPSTLGALATSNQELTKNVQELVAAIDEVIEKRTRDAETQATLAATYEKYRSQFSDTDKLSQASGQLLRDQRARLPRLAELRSELARRRQEVGDISFRRFEANQQLQRLEEIDDLVAEMLRLVPADDRKAAEQVVRDLLTNRADYLKSYIQKLEDLQAELSELISVKTALIDTTTNFREFIAKRDLWIRSCRSLWASKFEPGQGIAGWEPYNWKPAIEAVHWSFHPTNWLQVARDLWQVTRREPLTAFLLVTSIAVLLAGQREARRRIRREGEVASMRTCTETLPTVRAAWLTVVIALPWPLLAWSVGWMLDSPVIEAEFSRALSEATRTAAWVLLLSELLRQTCRSHGLADAHLGWPRPVLLQVRRWLRWVPVVIAPLVLWTVGLESQSLQPLWSASLGRMLFLLVMILLTIALWRLLLAGSSAIYQNLSRGSDNWLLSTHRAWRPAVVVLPVALAVMAVLGYYYTAQQLAARVLATAATFLALMVAGGLLRRWVLLSRRRLAREQAQKRRAQAQAAAEAAAADGKPAPETAVADLAPEEAVDLNALGEQTQKLLTMLLVIGGVIGTFMIWQDVFPALAWLDENSLPWLSGDKPMTWGHVLRSLVALVVTYVAVRDLPGLLELFVLQHSPFDAGVRYAIASLSRYAILAIGLVAAAAALGITGTSISWLVAAMGVGLGFGLQEIFANFVSGVILLFERPIRVGDIITLGDKTGIVNRIRMRATTIVDWDRKEYIVPNKDLVTERLLNWTLSNQTNRVTIEVGVAYGSDTDRACQLLREAVEEHPIVLDDPVPLITFEGFGDSALNLVLRCYLPNLDNRLLTIHALHTAIDKKFKAAGIEIAFPQRDLHIRSTPPGWEQPAPATAGTNGKQDAPRSAEVR